MSKLQLVNTNYQPNGR